MPNKITEYFEKLATYCSNIVGSPIWFFFSLTVIVLWVPSRFIFKSEELWHLFINTFTTILTFLMMSLLHASQSKWEKTIEKFEERQAKMLRYLEKETEEIKVNLNPLQQTMETKKDTKIQHTQNKKNTITSLF